MACFFVLVLCCAILQQSMQTCQMLAVIIHYLALSLASCVALTGTPSAEKFHDGAAITAITGHAVGLQLSQTSAHVIPASITGNSKA